MYKLPKDFADKPTHLQAQYKFAANIRDPEHCPKPAHIEPRRMKIYQELFFNNVEGFLAQTFPVIKSILDEKSWQDMVRDFYAHHTCTTPYFNEISQEFLLFLQQERKAKSDPVFLFELAHYEWVDLSLEIAEEEVVKLSVKDWLNQQPIVSPLLMILQYGFPVHKISKHFQPSEPVEQPTFLAVYRNDKDSVEFMELSALTAQLLTSLQQNENLTGSAILKKLADDNAISDQNEFIKQGLAYFEDFYIENLLLGTRPILRGKT